MDFIAKSKACLRLVLVALERILGSPIWGGLTFISVFIVLFLAPQVDRFFDSLYSQPRVYRFVNITPQEFDALPLNWRQMFSEVAANPARYDPKTVELLRKLSHADIGLVRDISHYVLGTADDPEDLPMVPFVVRDLEGPQGKLLDRFQYVHLSRLEGLGLLRHVHTPLELTFPLLRPPSHDRDITLIHGSHLALIVTRGEKRRPLDKEPVRLPVFQVTRPGYEIVSMLRPHTNFDYLEEIARLLLDQGFAGTITGFRTSPLTYPWALHFPGPYQTLEPDHR